MTDRVNHFAIISTGRGDGEPHSTWYWDANKAFYALFKQYGYPDEAIYRLSERGRQHDPTVGLATLDNLAKVFQHLAEFLTVNDHVFLLILGHGTIANILGDDGQLLGRCFAHSLVGDLPLLAPTLAQLVNQHLRTKDLTVAVHPCNSGACIPYLRAPGRVIVTSTAEDEGNWADWNGTFARGLKLEGRAQGRSILEAHQLTVTNAIEDFERTKEVRLRQCPDYKLEHPQLDDGAGGKLAAQRFLGDDGRPLHYSGEAVEWLRQRRSLLQLVG